MPSLHKKIPACIGIIMDGNRRWARKNSLPTLEGHRLGYEKIKELLSWAKEAGVQNVLVYAFSTENWNRTKDEVSYLMDLFRLMLKNEIRNLKKEGVRVRCIGEKERFSPDLQELMAKAEKETAGAKGSTLGICLSYGGRAEILSAANKAIAAGRPIDEASFSKLLWTSGLPDPDIIIRTGGEYRLSGFLTWQSVYSELFFTKTYWPAFTKKEFMDILDEFAGRERRIGR